MAIDRGPWNGLVDDDGSNLTGSIWNKAAIKTVILDPTDAALVTPWADVPFNAANFWAGVTAAHITSNQYVILGGKTLFWIMEIEAAPGPASGYYLPLVLPAGALVRPRGVLMPVTYAIHGSSVLEPNALVRADAALLGSSKIGVQHPQGGLWNTPVTAYFTAIVALQ